MIHRGGRLVLASIFLEAKLKGKHQEDIEWEKKSK